MTNFKELIRTQTVKFYGWDDGLYMICERCVSPGRATGTIPLRWPFCSARSKLT